MAENIEGTGQGEGLQDFEFETVTVGEHGEIASRKTCRAQKLIEPLAAGIDLEMVLVPAGAFLMGSRPGEGEPDEQPQHSVWIRSFLIGRCPVTQEQWAAVMDRVPPYRFKGDKLSADRISWKAAQDFCRRLSLKTGRAYRLPGEAEWEYACRAGSTTAFSFGKTLTTDLANYVGTVPFLLEPPGLSRHVTGEVGQLPPNAFGLHDMHGNLWEWCADAWHEGYTGAPADSTAWEGRPGAPRVLRGGSWHDPPVLCRSAMRLFHDPGEGEDIFGFRVALDASEITRQRRPSSSIKRFPRLFAQLFKPFVKK